MHCHSPLTSHTTQQSTLTTDPSTLSGLSLHSLLTIVHSHLTTQRSSLANHHLTLTTNNSPFHIHHSPLTNHQSPLMTQNSTLATPWTRHTPFTLSTNHGKVKQARHRRIQMSTPSDLLTDQWSLMSQPLTSHQSPLNRHEFATTGSPCLILTPHSHPTHCLRRMGHGSLVFSWMFFSGYVGGAHFHQAGGGTPSPTRLLSGSWIFKSIVPRLRLFLYKT